MRAHEAAGGARDHSSSFSSAGAFVVVPFFFFVLATGLPSSSTSGLLKLPSCAFFVILTSYLTSYSCFCLPFQYLNCESFCGEGPNVSDSTSALEAAASWA